MPTTTFTRPTMPFDPPDLPRRGGRPPKAPSEQMTEELVVMLSPRQAAAFRRAVEAEGMKVSVVLRQYCLRYARERGCLVD